MLSYVDLLLILKGKPERDGFWSLLEATRRLSAWEVPALCLGFRSPPPRVMERKGLDVSDVM
jgi:hypothetical protein